MFFLKMSPQLFGLLMVWGSEKHNLRLTKMSGHFLQTHQKEILSSAQWKISLGVALYFLT